MNKYREKTEFLQPFSKKVIEDVMFINTKKVVALEYIYYQQNDVDNPQNDVNIHKIIEKKNYIEKHPLGIDDYLPLPLEGESTLSAFTGTPVAFEAMKDKEGNDEQYVRQNKKGKDNKNDAELM